MMRSKLKRLIDKATSGKTLTLAEQKEMKRLHEAKMIVLQSKHEWDGEAIKNRKP